MVISFSALLTQATTPMAITRAMESLLSPLKRFRFPVHDFSLMMMIAIRFIPVLSDETQRVWKAQRSRGADLTRGSLKHRAGTLMSVIIPVFTGVFRRADDLAMALEARGYVPGQARTSMRRLAISSFDLLGGAMILTWCISAICLKWMI
jgi:energy-coupling factor transport system permease protein